MERTGALVPKVLSCFLACSFFQIFDTSQLVDRNPLLSTSFVIICWGDVPLLCSTDDILFDLLVGH